MKSSSQAVLHTSYRIYVPMYGMVRCWTVLKWRGITHHTTTHHALTWHYTTLHGMTGHHMVWDTEGVAWIHVLGKTIEYLIINHSPLTLHFLPIPILQSPSSSSPSYSSSSSFSSFILSSFILSSFQSPWTQFMSSLVSTHSFLLPHFLFHSIRWQPPFTTPYHIILQHTAVQHRVAQYSTVERNTVQCNRVQCSAVQWVCLDGFLDQSLNDHHRPTRCHPYHTACHYTSVLHCVWQ